MISPSRVLLGNQKTPKGELATRLAQPLDHHRAEAGARGDERQRGRAEHVVVLDEEFLAAGPVRGRDLAVRRLEIGKTVGMQQVAARRNMAAGASICSRTLLKLTTSNRPSAPRSMARKSPTTASTPVTCACDPPRIIRVTLCTPNRLAHPRRDTAGPDPTLNGPSRAIERGRTSSGKASTRAARPSYRDARAGAP